MVTKSLLVASASIVWLVSAPLHHRADLAIPPVYQQTPVWCWAAVGEMVFRHFGVANINPAGNYQCGIIALLHPACNANCMNCVVPAGSLSTMHNMLTQYPTFASQVTGTSTHLRATSRHQALSLESVIDQIEAARPVVAGISPSGYRRAVSEHVALIVGYDGGHLIVNDPFPFDLAFNGNPYLTSGGTRLRRGQYAIAYDAIRRYLNWQETIYDIRCSGQDCRQNGDDRDTARRRDAAPATGRSCRTPFG